MASATTNPAPPHVPRMLWQNVETQFFKCGGLSSCSGISEFLGQSGIGIHVLPTIVGDELKQVEARLEEERLKKEQQNQFVQLQQPSSNLPSPNNRMKRQHSVVLLDASMNEGSPLGSMRKRSNGGLKSSMKGGGQLKSQDSNLGLKRQDSNLGRQASLLKRQDSFGKTVTSSPLEFAPSFVESTGEQYLPTPTHHHLPALLPKREARFNPNSEDGLLSIEQLRGLMTALCREEFSAEGKRYSDFELKSRRDRDICNEAFDAVQASRIKDGELVLGKNRRTEPKADEERLTRTPSVRTSSSATNGNDDEVQTNSSAVAEDKFEEYLGTFGLSRGAMIDEETRLETEAARMIGLPRNSSTHQLAKSISDTDLKRLEEKNKRTTVEIDHQMSKERFMARMLPGRTGEPTIDVSALASVSMAASVVSSDEDTSPVDPTTGAVSFTQVNANKEQRRLQRRQQIEMAKKAILGEQAKRNEVRLNLEVENDVTDDTIMLRVTPGNTPRDEKVASHKARKGGLGSSTRQAAGDKDSEGDAEDGDGDDPPVYSEDGKLVTVRSLAVLGKLKSLARQKSEGLQQVNILVDEGDDHHHQTHRQNSARKWGSKKPLFEATGPARMSLVDQQAELTKNTTTTSLGQLDPERVLKAYLARRRKKPKARTVATQTDCYSFTQLWLGSRTLDKGVSTEDRYKDSQPGEVVSVVLRKKTKAMKAQQQQRQERDREEKKRQKQLAIENDAGSGSSDEEGSRTLCIEACESTTSLVF